MGMQRMKRQLARISRQNAEILRRLKKRLAAKLLAGSPVFAEFRRDTKTPEKTTDRAEKRPPERATDERSRGGKAKDLRNWAYCC